MFHQSLLKLKKKSFTQLHKVSTLINMTTFQLKSLDLESYPRQSGVLMRPVLMLVY